MNQEEEDIQHALESGSTPLGNGREIAAYKAVFSSLSKLPELKTSSDIESIVLARIIKRRQQQSRRDYIWLSLGIFLLFIACIIAVAFSGVKMHTSFLTRIPDVTGIVIFGIVFVVALNRLDKKLVLKDADRLPL
jgi:uncharacterized membrane protein